MTHHATIWQNRQREGQRAFVPSRPGHSVDRVLVAVAIGWREAMVVAVVIPTTILLTLFASQVMGYT